MSRGTFFAIDFDRCITKGEMFNLLYVEVLDELGVITYVDMIGVKDSIESKGGSFQMLTYLRDNGLFDKNVEGQVADAFVKRAEERRHDVVADDADDLFVYLQKERIPHAIISYGDNDWQELKIKAAGFEDIPHQIVSHPRKSDELRSWLEGDLYRLPRIFGGELADEIVLIDDKAVAFDDLPARVRGYWMRAKDGSLLPSQQGAVPDSVQIVYDFKSIIEKEKNL